MRIKDELRVPDSAEDKDKAIDTDVTVFETVTIDKEDLVILVEDKFPEGIDDEFSLVVAKIVDTVGAG